MLAALECVVSDLHDGTRDGDRFQINGIGECVISDAGNGIGNNVGGSRLGSRIFDYR